LVNSAIELKIVFEVRTLRIIVQVQVTSKYIKDPLFGRSKGLMFKQFLAQNLT